MQIVHIDHTNQGRRVDAFVSENFKVHSRSFLKHNWDTLVSVNDKIEKPSYKLRIGDMVKVSDENVDKLLEEHSYGEIIPQHHDLDIMYEDKDCLIVNKPKGIVVHPGVGNPKDTLVNYVVEYLQSKNEYDERVVRGGIVHRLDKPVSGLILFAKTAEAQLYYQKQFEDHTVNKVYLATVEYNGNINNELKEKIPSTAFNVSEELDNLIEKDFELDNSWLKAEGYIGRSTINRMKMVFKSYTFNHGKHALSYIKPLSKDQFLIIIKTGRMYQIRATLEYLGVNIVGDTQFETLRGGEIPTAIALESVLISCRDMQGNKLIKRLK
jgi:23S rRNA pseudouridine1911/1915/1917 synthase